MVKKCNSNQKWNKHNYRCECKIEENIICIIIVMSAKSKKTPFAQKDFIWNPSTTCTSENGKYLKSIIGNSVIPYDEEVNYRDNKNC